MIRLRDICRGRCVCPSGDFESGRCNDDCDLCSEAECSCGLPWDAERGCHTVSGIRITYDVYARILAREGQAIETDERREAEREAIRASRRVVIGGGR